MKMRFLAYFAAGLAALSCGSLGQVQTQTFDDGLYYTKPAAAEVAVSDDAVDNLLADTKDSPAYIISQGDTIAIPSGGSVRLSTSNSVITVTETPSWAWNYTYPYTPWYYSSWGYNYYGWHPWAYWDSWYYPYRWHYYSYWDPWYYSSWYSPWYYSSWHYYDYWY